MTTAQASRLIRLYPAGWRAKYGPEFIELLEREALGAALIVSIAAGALDARVSPKTWLHDPVDANAYTLRVWRIPMPTANRSFALEVGILLGLVAGLKAAGDLTAWATGDATLKRAADVSAVPIAATVGTVALWLRGFSWRTKAVGASMVGGLSTAVLSGIGWMLSR